ncbi:MAG: transcription initiation factor IIB [Thermoplasmatota archaeon]
MVAESQPEETLPLSASQKPSNAAAIEQGRCPECNGRLTRDAQRGETLCSNCGLVVEENAIDYGPDWRSYDRESGEKRAHTGAPLTESLHDYGLSTVMGRFNKDAQGRAIPSKKRLEIARMRRLHARATLGSGAKRNLARAIAEIHRMATALDVPRPVAEEAIHLYRRAASESLIQGRSIEGIASAALFAACRLAGVPRDPERFTQEAQVDKRTLLRLHRVLVRAFELREPQPKPQDYLARFASGLKLSPVAEGRARELVGLAEKTGLTSGRSPAGVASAALYVASRETGEARTQKEVADTVGVTEVTVRNRTRDLLKLPGVELPPLPSASAVPALN